MKKIIFVLATLLFSTIYFSCGMLFGQTESIFELENRTSKDIVITEIKYPMEYLKDGQQLQLPATVAAGDTLNLQMIKWGEGVVFNFTYGGKNYELNEYTEHSSNIRYIITEQNGKPVAQNNNAIKERQ